MDIKKLLIILLIVVVILSSISAVSAGWFDGLFGWGDNENKNITLIKEYTYGEHFIRANGDDYTTYELYGVLKDLPDDVTGYTLRVAIYDENEKLVKEDEGFASMYTISDYSERSEPAWLGYIELNDFINISFYELKLYNPDGEIVLEENVTFTMGNIQTFDLRSSDSSSSTSSSSSTTSSSSSSSSSSDSNSYPYIGNAATGKFHTYSCNDVGKMLQSNMVFFSTRDDAINHGYTPCGHCNA